VSCSGLLQFMGNILASENQFSKRLLDLRIFAIYPILTRSVTFCTVGCSQKKHPAKVAHDLQCVES
jgi:hypothetical protein